MNPLGVSLSTPSSYGERRDIELFIISQIPILKQRQAEIVKIGQSISLDWSAQGTEPIVLQIKDANDIIVGAISGTAPAIIPLSYKENTNVIVSSEHLEQSPKIRELEYVAVAEEWRGLKIASGLISALESYYTEQGVEYLYGNVCDSPTNVTELASFYTKKGFELSARMPNFLNLNWSLPNYSADFYFYKKLSK